MSFKIAFKSLLVGLFFGVLATVAAALISTGIWATVPRAVLIYGVVAALIGFVANFMVLNKRPDSGRSSSKEYSVSRAVEDAAPEEKPESKLLVH